MERQWLEARSPFVSSVSGAPDVLSMADSAVASRLLTTANGAAGGGTPVTTAPSSRAATATAAAAAAAAATAADVVTAAAAAATAAATASATASVPVPRARTCEEGGIKSQPPDEETAVPSATEESTGPVDLVCAKQKFEGAPSSLEVSPDSSLALSFLMRRRRRGRSRYAPYPPGGQSSGDLGGSGGASVGSSGLPTLGARSSGGQFVCPHCKSLFSNRDALAMHMLDSVRSDGACGGGAPAVASAAVAGVTSAAALAHNGPAAIPSVAPSTASGATGVSNGVAAVAGASPGGTSSACLTCRVCSESLPSLDTMAMHMLAHAHQEQLRLESHRMEGLQSVMKRVASHYSDLLRGFVPPQAPPALPASSPQPQAASFIVKEPPGPASASPTGSSPAESKLNLEEAIEEEPGTEVVVKVEEEAPPEAVAAVEAAIEETPGLEEAVAVLEGAFPFVCRHCLIAFADRTMFCLHMGLHNVNNPWQCNMCGKVCSGRHEFASHVLHF